MQSTVLISRCVTIHRQWDFVRLWVGNDSLFDSKIEWLIINDAPDTPCPLDLRQHLERRGATLIEPRLNLGRSEARNSCARAATGQWLEFVDGDDVPLPLDLDWFPSAGSTNILSFPLATYRLDSGQIEQLGVESPTAFCAPHVLKRVGDVIQLPATVAYKNSLFESSGGFDGRYDGIEDLHLLFKMENLSPVVAQIGQPKQLYRTATMAERADGEMRPIYWLALFRSTYLTSETPAKDLLASFLETSRFMTAQYAIKGLIRDIDVKKVRPTGDSAEMLVHPGQSAQQLFWSVKNLLKTYHRLPLLFRIKEGLKLLLGR